MRCICVFGVLPLILLTVKLNLWFQNRQLPSLLAPELWEVVEVNQKVSTHPPKKGGAKNEARGEGVILWIHDCLYAPPHPSIAQSSSSCSSAQKRININTYPSNPVPSIPPSKKRKKKIITLGYQLIKPSWQPLLAQKPRKDNKGKVLGSNKRIEINTVPRDLPLSHCHPPQ